MKVNKEESKEDIDLVHSTLKSMILRMEAKQTGYEENGFPWASKPEEVVWLLGLTPDENHRLNWILHGQENVIQEVINVH
ncbi:MAG: hypothetical protein OQK04_10625 [Kangiellaceae bacterium]|nr:hypothetical protein [Kangiellaceae bacterium]MCW8999159.1 hypothetical protein [Kangiellaceae bacterium]